MARYTKRVQTTVTDEQYQMLHELSEQRHEPIGRLVREAVRQTYGAPCAPVSLEQRQAALASLLSLNVPVADWPQMEDEIMQAYLDDL